MRLVILTGASGSGKTAIAEAIASERPPLAEVLHFDRNGVPPLEERLVRQDLEGAWQRAMTFEWMGRISRMTELNRPVLFEGQMRLAFVRESLSSVGLMGARIILVDCDDATRAHRLISERRQPDLASPKMMIWAAYLRKEARETGCEVLETTGTSLESSVLQVRRYLELS